MKLPRRQFLHLAVGAAALPVVSQIARAQAYPTRPVSPHHLVGRCVLPPRAAGGLGPPGIPPGAEIKMPDPSQQDTWLVSPPDVASSQQAGAFQKATGLEATARCRER